MRFEFSLVSDLISRFSLLYLSFTWERKERARKKKKKKEKRTHTHAHTLHSFLLLLHWQTHTHTRSLSFPSLTLYVMKNRRAKLHKSKKFLSFTSVIISICLLLNRTNKNWRKCLYWIRYQMQVRFDIND
jgi:hypothetical protein